MSSTPLQFFMKWEKNTPERPFLRQPLNGQWRTYSYHEVGIEIRRIAASLRLLNLLPGSRIAILSKNCAHWIMTDLAIMLAGFISVPIYPTLSASAIAELLEHSGASVIFLGKLDSYEKQRIAISSQTIKISFPFYGPNEGVSWDELIKCAPLTGEEIPDADDVATIMYSSGTTGTPKGVVLSHGAFGYVGEVVSKNLKINSPQRMFSYLPLSHIAERGLMEMVALASGSCISFAESLDTFSKDLQHEKPTIFGGVPRIYQKFQEGILKKLPQRTLDRLLAVPFVRQILKRYIQKKLGLAAARIIVSGAAPTPVSVIEWFSRLDITIREVYGMTENTALSHANFDRVKVGTVGQAWPGVEVRLSDEGEILLRHKALMKHYYNDEKTTALVFTTDGFLRTGDMGVTDDEGFLTITGRIKDQFKTDKAKFVAPAPIETAFQSNTLIDQCCVVGMGIPQPIALVTLTNAASAETLNTVITSLRETLVEVNRSLENYEQVKSVIVLKGQWSIENGLLTPSLKVKRNEIEKLFTASYKTWYSRGEDVIYVD